MKSLEQRAIRYYIKGSCFFFKKNDFLKKSVTSINETMVEEWIGGIALQNYKINV